MACNYSRSYLGYLFHRFLEDHRRRLKERDPEELVDLGLLQIHVVADEPGQLLHPGFRVKYSVLR